MLVHKPPLRIKRRALLRRLPPRTERFARLLMAKDRVQQIISCGLKVLDLALAPHNERERRCLDASDRQHEPIVPRTPRRKRIGAREIHPDEPVRTRTRQCRAFQRKEIGIIAQVAERIVDALVIERVDEDAPHGLFVAEEVQYLVHEQLPLAVGVTAVHDLIRARDQPLDHGELLRRALVHDEPPLSGQDRQILRAPTLELRIVFLRLCLPEDMTEEPRHHAAARLDPSLSLAMRLRQTRGKCTPDTRLLRDVEPHANTFESAQTRRTNQRITTMDATTSMSVP